MYRDFDYGFCATAKAKATRGCLLFCLNQIRSIHEFLLKSTTMNKRSKSHSGSRKMSII